MRKISSLIALLLTIITCSFSCNKHNNQAYMHATNAAGAPWTADECLATRTTEGVTIEGTYKGNGANIAIYLPKNYTTGTFTIDTGANSFRASYENKAINFAMACSGNVTLTSTSPNITGTFNFTCTDSTQVEQGTFSVPAP